MFPHPRGLTASIRGTVSTGDILTDACGSSQPFGDGIGHSGMAGEGPTTRPADPLGEWGDSFPAVTHRLGRFEPPGEGWNAWNTQDGQEALLKPPTS